MAECKRISFPRRGFCSGDLDRKITIKSRTLTSPIAGVDFGEEFGNDKSVWAAVQTSKGRSMFYTTNMDEAVSHVFGIRWYAGFTSDYWIEYKGEKYDILDVENLDERDEFYLLYCNVRGDQDQEVNFA